MPTITSTIEITEDDQIYQNFKKKKKGYRLVIWDKKKEIKVYYDTKEDATKAFEFISSELNLYGKAEIPVDLTEK